MALNSVFGTYSAQSLLKRGFNLNRSVMGCADLARIINSDQVQSKLREVRQNIRLHDKTKKNPLSNPVMMNKLNPFAKKKGELLASMDKQRQSKRLAALKAKKTKEEKKAKVARNQKWSGL